MQITHSLNVLSSAQRRDLARLAETWEADAKELLSGENVAYQCYQIPAAQIRRRLAADRRRRLQIAIESAAVFALFAVFFGVWVASP